MLPLILGGLAAGGAKHFLSDKPKRRAAQGLHAEAVRYSPWSKIDTSQFSSIPDANLIGSLMQGGMTGAMFAQGLQGSEIAAAHPHQAAVNFNAGMTSPWAMQNAPGGFTPQGTPIFMRPPMPMSL